MSNQPHENLIDRYIDKANTKIKTGWIKLTFISIFRNILIAAIFLGTWAAIMPEKPTEQLIVAIVAFIVATISGGRFKRYKIDKTNYILSMEIRFPNTKHPITHLKNPNKRVSAEQEWAPLMDSEIKRIQGQNKRKLKNHLSSLALPALICLALFSQVTLNLKDGFATVSGTMFNFNKSYELKVAKGGTDDDKGEPYSLSASKPITIELNGKNNLILSIKDGSLTNPPTMLLKYPKDSEDPQDAGKLHQSFQLIPADEKPGHKATEYRIAFSATKDTELYIPLLSDQKPVARLNIKSLPLPKVKLTLDPENIKQPWPDEKPLGLKITAHAKNPLQSINLIIRSGKKSFEERVFNIMSDDVRQVNQNHDLILEQFVESDQTQVEIVAQAIDRSTPIPLVGYSDPIMIQTASAYGRYRNTLSTLKEIKSIIDTNITKQDPKLSQETIELAQKAYEQSSDSPFFDALDRVEINKFKRSIERNFTDDTMTQLMTTSSELNEFLLEHESLDDRERDRDFFVATRAMSRLLEKEKKYRPVTVASVSERMKTFLDDRHLRWTIRVTRVGEYAPDTWDQIKNNKPFHKTMDQLIKLDGTNDNESSEKSIEALAKTVKEYRDWINALEDAEDKSREQKEQERQQGLANARNEIRELQKQQGQISSTLDKAATQEKSDLEDKWSITKLKQNNNIKNTKKLSDKMRSLSPEAGARVDAALEAMEATKNSGDDNNFVLAESNSDLAGRMLRQANNAAQKSQQQRPSRGSRKRVLGDKYFGKNVTGGDIEINRDYEVDRRYREDILEEVSSFESNSQEEDALLKNYLREVVR